MKICLVTTFPPSTGGLSEYGFHIAQELRSNPFLSLTVLADEMPGAPEEIDGFSVERCWSFDDPKSALRLSKAIHRLKPDVVWFNLLFSTFGRNPFAAFSGLMTPLLARLSGRYTHVTLHHLMDTVDLQDAGIRHERLYRMAGAVATRMLLMSNSVSVLMPNYREILRDKYGRDNVHLRAHGTLMRRPQLPDFSRRGNPAHRILAFGKWGTYKRLELMIEAFNLISAKIPDATLVVGGGDHPQAAGYVESVRKMCVGNPQIEFRGYIPEDALGDLFQTSSVAVMPYSSSTGCSGVAHLASAYAVPIVCADLTDFRQMGQVEELAMEFYRPGSAEDLADCLVQLLQSPEKQQAMAMQNFSAALRMTMPNVVRKYLRSFELQRRAKALKHVARFRRLPRWLPSKSLWLRLLTKRSLGWARHPQIFHETWTERDDFQLLNGNRNRGGKLDRTGAPVDGDGIGASGLPLGGDGLTVHFPSTGDANQNHHGQNAGAEDSEQPPTLLLTSEYQTGSAQAEQPERVQGLAPAVPLLVRRGGDDRES